MEDLAPDLDLRSSAPASACAGVLGADACAAASAAESWEKASDARRSLAQSSRSPATAGRCAQKPMPIALLAFLHIPSMSAGTRQIRLLGPDTKRTTCHPLLLPSDLLVLGREEGCEEGVVVLKGGGSRHWRASGGVRAAFGLTSAARETGRQTDSQAGRQAAHRRMVERGRRFDYGERNEKLAERFAVLPSLGSGFGLVPSPVGGRHKSQWNLWLWAAIYPTQSSKDEMSNLTTRH